MSAEETFNSMQMAMMKAEVRKDDEATMARYLRILNPSLAHEVDLYPYNTPTELLHKAIQVKKKLKFRSVPPTKAQPTTSNWRSKLNPQGKGNTRDQRSTKERKDKPISSSTPRPQGPFSKDPKGSTYNPYNTHANVVPRSREIECYKCHGKRTLC